MTLPFPPQLSGDTAVDIDIVYKYIVRLINSFANSVGEAIDPSVGQGGDGSLTVTDTPTNVTYNSGSSTTVDGSIIGHIDIVFVKPDRAVDIVIYYREQGTADFKQSYASTSPARLLSLKPAVIYEIQLAGQAANGSLGPVSEISAVYISSVTGINEPTDLTAIGTYQSVVLTWTAPTDTTLLKYQVQRADDSDFTSNVVMWDSDGTYFIDDIGIVNVTKYYRVRSVDRSGSFSSYTTGVSSITLNVPDNSITYGKVQDVIGNRLLGRGNGGTGVMQELTVGSLLRFNGTTLEGNPDTGWSVTGTTTDKGLTSGDTLIATQDVLGTLINVLIGKGIL